MWQASWSWSPPPPPPPLEVGATTVMLLVSNVTAPPSAKTLPATLTPVVTVSLVNAIRFPAKAVPVPRVDELPTCQNTLLGVRLKIDFWRLDHWPKASI